MATITTPAVIAGEVIETSWGNSVRADLLTLNTEKLERNGAVSMTGQLTLQAANPTSGNHATRKAYVDAQVATRALTSGDTFTGTVQMMGDGVTNIGTSFNTLGHIRNVVGDTGAGGSSMAYKRVGSVAADPGEVFVYFLRTSAGTAIGSIVINGAGTGVNFNATSDRRVKDDLGPLNPDSLLRRILALTPRRLRGKATGIEFDGFIADEVQPIVPAAVTGEPEAMWPDDHPNEDLRGQPKLQQFSATEIITPLVGAVQALAARLDKLEGVGTAKARKARS